MKNVELNEALIKLLHVAIKSDEDLVETLDYIHNGVIFIDENGPVKTVNRTIAELARREFGYSWDIWNQQFHKTWDKVATCDLDTLVAEQLANYFSTYGMEAMGLKATPFIPVEDILSAELRPSIEKFMVIRLVDDKFALDMVDEYLKTIVKPNAANMKYIDAFAEVTLLNPEDIKSFEIKCLYYDKNAITPEASQDLLRYLIYSTTGGTLIIKNKSTIELIKTRLTTNKDVADKAHAILHRCNVDEVSKIFLRNKALFLAYKVDKRNAPIINKLRRLATVNHEPLSEVTVANVMNLLGQGRTQDVLKVLAKTSNRNLIKLINFAADTESDSHIYNIRNGKVYVNEKPVNKEHAEWLKSNATEQLAKNLKGKLAGKEYFIPAGLNYAAPISEKQLIGNIPYGTTVSAPEDSDALCASIAWDNFKGQRTDIDFHLNSATRHFGWNAGYRDNANEVLYSGDMTDATNGATETFRFKATDEVFLASVSLYSGDSKCPFKFFLSDADNFRDKNEGIVDIGRALTFPVKLAFDGSNRSLSLGYMIGTTFTFYGGNLGSNIVPKADLYKNALTAITNRCKVMISLADIITMAGGKIVDTIEDNTVDLSPENITEPMIFEIID